jgi:uncharacterized protein (DUF58 family)
VTMRGAWAIVLLGLALTLTAGAFDAPPLYVPGVGFIALAAIASAWVWAAARGVRVHRTIGAARVLEGEALRVELVVRAGRLPLPTGLVEDPLLPAPAPLVAGRRVTRLEIGARFERRGRRVLEPARVHVRDAFGIAARSVQAREAHEVLVLPRVLPVQAPREGGAGIGLVARGRPIAAAETDLDGLRPYRPGAPASRVAWAAFARTGELLERRLRADADTRPLIVLDARAPRRPEDLDAAVRAAASLCVHLAREGGCALLLPGDRRPTALEPELRGWPHLHARLALVEPGGAPALAGLAARRGPVIYVAALAAARPPRALAHAPGGGRLLVVPGTLPGRQAAFAVAGCHGYELSAARARAERIAS